MTNKIFDWASGTRYTEFDVVIVKGESAAFDDKIYRCVSDHTSFSFTTDFGNSFWELVETRGIQGPNGDAGAVGAQGIQGIQGTTGTSGTNGVDGVIAAIATLGDAQAAVDNTLGMTPLRVKDSIDFQLIADRAAIAANTAENAVAGGNAALSNRITVLENSLPLTVASGHQRIINSNGPEDILGVDASVGNDGRGARLELNNTGARSARVDVEIYRKDDLETRVTTCVLILQYVPTLNTWFVERESTTIITGNPDGVVFDITTNNPAAGIFVGVVNYTSDNMAGGNYDIDSYVRYVIREIKNTL